MVEAILSAGGMAFIMAFSVIFRPLREKFAILECPLCTGFHLGYIVYALRGGTSIMDAYLAAVVSSILGLALLDIFDR